MLSHIGTAAIIQNKILEKMQSKAVRVKFKASEDPLGSNKLVT